MCGHGERAMTAASLLERGGRQAAVFEGSPADWARTFGEQTGTGAVNSGRHRA